MKKIYSLATMLDRISHNCRPKNNISRHPAYPTSPHLRVGVVLLGRRDIGDILDVARRIFGPRLWILPGVLHSLGVLKLFPQDYKYAVVLIIFISAGHDSNSQYLVWFPSRPKSLVFDAVFIRICKKSSKNAQIKHMSRVCAHFAAFASNIF